MTTVIGLIGRSYCGSSVVNLVLASHPAIFGGGELHRLAVPELQLACRVCGKACAYWTAAFLDAQRAHFDYGAIADHAGVDVVVDASKAVDWFEDGGARRAGHALIDICLAKHPMRHVASFIDNQYYARQGLLAQINAAGGDISAVALDEEALSAYAAEMAQSILGTYQRALARFAPNGSPPRLLRYEDFVRDRQTALAPILAFAGLEFHPAMNAYETAQHHGLGGNAGAYFVIRKEAAPAQQARFWQRKIETDAMSKARHDYYDGVAGIELDDKYLRTVPAAVRARLMATDAYRALADLLGYSLDPANT